MGCLNSNWRGQTRYFFKQFYNFFFISFYDLIGFIILVAMSLRLISYPAIALITCVSGGNMACVFLFCFQLIFKIIF